MNEPRLFRPEHLFEFCERVFRHLDVPEPEARLSAEVLAAAETPMIPAMTPGGVWRWAGLWWVAGMGFVLSCRLQVTGC